jgi:hypothetical protein
LIKPTEVKQHFNGDLAAAAIAACKQLGASTSTC